MGETIVIFVSSDKTGAKAFSDHYKSASLACQYSNQTVQRLCIEEAFMLQSDHL